MKEIHAVNTSQVRVLYDYQTFHIQRFGGISRYFCEIIQRMERVKPNVSVAFSMNQYLKNIGSASFCQVQSRFFKIFEGLFRWLNIKKSLRDIRTGRYDVFHPTYYSPYFLEALKGRPFVLTIHDMTHERCPQCFGSSDPTAENKRLLAEKADRIIAISENTKRDIMDLLHIDEDKIDVIYHGFTPRSLAQDCGVVLPPRYVLYIGERRGYKNFEVLLKAFVALHSEEPDICLVLTGRPLSKSEHEIFESSGITDAVICKSGVSDSVLDILYHNASIFVYPSLYEGFGIPILEAFAQRCPVLLSNASCFPEIGGDACAYFEPLSELDLLDKMKHILHNKNYRNSLVSAGQNRLQLFTWEKTARQTEETYRKVLR